MSSTPDIHNMSDNIHPEHKSPYHRTVDLRILFAGLFMLLAIVGISLALYAQSMSTDNRSQASETDNLIKPAYKNLVINNSFENKLQGWKRGVGARISIGRNRSTNDNSTPSNLGSYSLKIAPKSYRGDEDAMTQSVSQPIHIKPNTLYEISVWAKSDEQDPDYYHMLSLDVAEDISPNQGPEHRLSTVTEADYFFPTNEWQLFKTTAKSASSFNSDASRLYVIAEGGRNRSYIYVDQISITEIPSTTPITPTKAPSYYPTPTTPSPSITYYPTPPSSNAYKLINSPEVVNVTCVQGRPCSFSQALNYSNVTSSNLIDTRVFVHQGKGSFKVNGVDQTTYTYSTPFSPGTGPEVVFTAFPDPSKGLSTVDLVIDAKQCYGSGGGSIPQPTSAPCRFMQGHRFVVNFATVYAD